MAAPTITWTHATVWASDGDTHGVAWCQFAMPTGMKWWGGWAESSQENGITEVTSHYSCTPTAFSGSHNYGTGDHPMVGSHCSYDSNTDTTYIHVGFKCDTGSQIRTHMFTVT